MTNWTWPVPDGWLEETIPFPLAFAPDIRFTGTEELRFSPGFFKAGAPDHWSYAFAWLLRGSPALDLADLSGILTDYWTGLCTAVSGERFSFDRRRFAVHLRRGAAAARVDHLAAQLAGTASIYDPFATGEPVTLRLRIDVWDCSRRRRRIMLLAASPSRRRAVWAAVESCREGFRCH